MLGSPGMVTCEHFFIDCTNLLVVYGYQITVKEAFSFICASSSLEMCIAIRSGHESLIIGCCCLAPKALMAREPVYMSNVKLHRYRA